MVQGLSWFGAAVQPVVLGKSIIIFLIQHAFLSGKCQLVSGVIFQDRNDPKHITHAAKANQHRKAHSRTLADMHWLSPVPKLELARERNSWLKKSFECPVRSLENYFLSLLKEIARRLA